ncbi:HAD family hydrolase [Sedimenticola selenatireducens]|uniref:HAD family hydrolase n=1 Tax=Sedimenticola selenatireducens TaxID=191960 RepID=A0A558DZ45_9GAMM|nr:HAD family hydrolase [Sedimenticola selenatireducens]TVO71459.1 HAD family hydrolase [Sedimenticola selenatireducens]TVT66148.1 MAG: HAD family hydrolase [Sedimenticola selenatireducens]
MTVVQTLHDLEGKPPSGYVRKLDIQHCIFDWGNTLMVDLPEMEGPMCSWSQVSMVEGADRVLAALSAQYRCHLATSAADSDEHQIRQALERVGLSRFIERIFCSHTLGCGKDSPQFYTQIQQSLGCPSSNIVMIGDSFSSDVASAIASGLQAVWFNPMRQSVPEGIIAIHYLEELI